tara:strand:+ start:142 stop:681 length:540 start_codon:yes stop_codon:yes gene_type:complete
MNKSKSVPISLCDIKINPLKKSSSLSELDETHPEFFYEDFFEGDGPLGIVFINHNGKTMIKNIIENTVASEYYDLKTEMIIVDIDNENIEHLSHEQIISKINKKWKKNNRIYLKFKKMIYYDIIKKLNDNDLIHYYDKIVDLGAKILDDLNYIILDDLIKMNFTKLEITKFKNINPNLS